MTSMELCQHVPDKDLARPVSSGRDVKELPGEVPLEHNFD